MSLVGEHPRIPYLRLSIRITTLFLMASVHRPSRLHTAVAHRVSFQANDLGAIHLAFPRSNYGIDWLAELEVLTLLGSRSWRSGVYSWLD
jgi:hypothetical protein